jgi:hypothetical protein
MVPRGWWWRGRDALGDLKLTNPTRKIPENHEVTLSLGPPFTPTPSFNLKTLLYQ